MILCFDLDGTLCEQRRDGRYECAKPFAERIRKVNKLWGEGHEIIICTARGAETSIDWERLTRWQLDQWGVLYTRLSFRKEYADVYIDDKGRDAEGFFQAVA